MGIDASAIKEEMKKKPSGFRENLKKGFSKAKGKAKEGLKERLKDYKEERHAYKMAKKRERIRQAEKQGRESAKRRLFSNMKSSLADRGERIVDDSPKINLSVGIREGKPVRKKEFRGWF